MIGSLDMFADCTIRHSRVVDQDIDTTPSRLGFLHHGPALIRRGHVEGANPAGWTFYNSGPLKAGEGRFACGEDESPVAFEEAFRQCKSKTGAGASDQHDRFTGGCRHCG